MSVKNVRDILKQSLELEGEDTPEGMVVVKFSKTIIIEMIRQLEEKLPVEKELETCPLCVGFSAREIADCQHEGNHENG